MIKSLQYIVSVLTVLLLLISANSTGYAQEEKNDNKDYVILLHGMSRTKRSMQKLENYLNKNGFKTVNPGYPSTEKSIEKIASEDIATAIEICKNAGAKKIHFVTHSLGGIALRQYLQTNELPEGSRVVMLAPPNKGNELTDFFKDYYIYKKITGPAGQALTTGPDSLPNKLKPVKAEIGVIAGSLSVNPLYSTIVPGQDDGKVSIESTKLKEMTDFTIVSGCHPFIMKDKTAMKETVHFLQHGKFINGGHNSI